MRQLVLIASALLLSACGGSRSDSGTVAPPLPPPPVTLADTFYSAVLSFTGAAPEDQEPAVTDAVALTAPEDSEPVLLP